MPDLASILKSRIAENGPMTVAEFMSEALLHPCYGYYAKQDPFGRQGDFITAPEVSQMFGEMIGLWAAHYWLSIGSPSPVSIIELGPGRGTLQADAQRAIKKALPDCWAAAEVHLVEASPALMEAQAKTLENQTSAPLTWHQDLSNAPKGPFILLANEFLDALPIEQYEYDVGAWHQRRIGLAKDQTFEFQLGPAMGSPKALPETLKDEPETGDIWETCTGSHEIVAGIAGRLRVDKGAALLIDYGHEVSGFGDTFQAIKNHAYASVLETPGDADLTAHVDFAALSSTALKVGACTTEIQTQASFLTALGIEARAEALKSAGTEDQAKQIDRDLNRLISPGQMGKLFKGMALYSPELPAPPGFKHGFEQGRAT
jgi:SAM-dependent MidA family methyltransferase